MPRLRVQGIGFIAAACLALAAPAGAATTTIAPTGSGLTLPGGVARDNAGALWVSDAVLGVCKVDPALPGGNALVDDGKYCTGNVPVEPVEPPVGAPPAPVTPPERPTATFQLAFDPATSSLFVAEGSSGGSGVWKFAIDGSSTITSATKIISEADRVFGLALGTATDGTPVLDYTTKRSPLIHRVLNPATCDPCSPLGAGSAIDGGGIALANLNGVLYIAEELSGVSRLENPGPAGGVAAPVVGFPGGTPTALAADNARGRVYAGTTNGNHVDQVDVLDVATGAVETYALGFNGVTALFSAPDGELVVADDPALAAETAGNGRILSVGLEVLGRPHAVITAAPASFINAGSAAFAFTGPAGATFECRLDPAGDASPWTPCGGPATGSFDTGSLSEGIHAFEVRAVSVDPAIGAGPIQRRTFVSDHTAPQVTIDNPASDAVLTGATALTMRFSASDSTSAFACSLDGGAAVPCSDPRRLTGLALGDHVFAVTATDAAGNASAPVVFAFTVRPKPADAPADAQEPGTGGRSTQGGTLLAPRLSAALRPGPVRLIRSRSSLAKLRSHRRVVVRLVAPEVARDAVVTLWRTSARRPRAGRAPLAFGSLKLARTGRQDVALTLTRAQAARLRAGRYLVAITLTDGAQRYGPTRFRRLTLLR